MGDSSLSTVQGYYMKRGSIDSTYENQWNNFGLAVPSDKLSYGLFFDTAVYTGSNNLTSQTIKFLGQDYTVSSSTTTKVELAPVGGSVGLKGGESATVGDYTVMMDSIATASGGSADIFLKVCKGDVCSASTGFKSGDSKTLTVGTATVGVTVSSVAYGASAAVLVGTTSLKLEDAQTITNFPNWRANIGKTAGNSGDRIQNMTITYVQPHSSFSGSYQVLQNGQSISAPNNFFVLKNVGYETRDYYRITASTGSNSNFNGGSSSSQQGVTFKVTNPTTGVSAKVWDVGGGTFSDAVAFDLTSGYWRYLNSTSGWQDTGNSIPSIQLTDTTLNLASYNISTNTSVDRNSFTADAAFGSGEAASDRMFEIKDPSLTAAGKRKAFQIIADYSFAGNTYARFNWTTVGSLAGDSNPNYFGYNDAASNTSTNFISLGYGGSSPKTRSAFTSNFGTKVVSIDQTQIVVDVPKSENYIDVVLGREAGAATAGGTLSSKTPIQITSDVAKLDNEISDASKMTTDMVVMGGPAVNKLAADLQKVTYPTHGVDSGIPENAALVKVFQNAFGSGKVAVLIAGWDAPQTDLAVAAIQAGKVTLAEPAVKISGTVAAPSVEKA